MPQSRLKGSCPELCLKASHSQQSSFSRRVTLLWQLNPVREISQVYLHRAAGYLVPYTGPAARRIVHSPPRPREHFELWDIRPHEAIYPAVDFDRLSRVIADTAFEHFFYCLQHAGNTLINTLGIAARRE